jgi:hypothetical protein
VYTEARTVLRAVVTNIRFNCWCLVIRSNNYIRHEIGNGTRICVCMCVHVRSYIHRSHIYTDHIYTQITWRKLKFDIIVQPIRVKCLSEKYSSLLSGRRFFGKKGISVYRASLLCMARHFFFFCLEIYLLRQTC